MMLRNVQLIWICPAQMAGMKLKVDEMERERDFYFHKLRDIEILCTISGMQHHPVSAL